MRTKPTLTILLIALLAGAVFGQTLGTWKMNPAKSKHNDQGALPRSLVIRYEAHAEGEMVTIWRVTQDGRSETDSFILRYDGRDYPHPRTQRFDLFSARKLRDGATEVLFKKDGKVVGRQVRRLSGRGKQLTIEHQLVLATGERVERLLVFEKQQD